MSAPGPVKLPPAVAALLEALTGDGHPAHLVGPAVPALLAGEPVRDFEAATSLEGAALLARLPRAVALDAARRRAMLPTADGPVDLVPWLPGDDLRAVLGRRDFTRHAMALDAAGALHDPFGGLDDERAGRLCCVADPAQRFAADPLCALRALRLVATRGLAPGADVVDALPAAAAGLAALPASALRAELHALLLGPHARRALELLRESGLEALIASGVPEDAARVVGALPAELELRLAGWLRGGRSVRTLRRLREPRERVVAVERLLNLHPVDALVRPSQEARLRRLRRRSAPLLPGLFALREAELAAAGGDALARRRLARLRDALARAALPARSGPAPLALDGRAVMKILGCRPGPEVGRALRQLAKAVEADPSCNTAASLRERLLAWRSEGPQSE